MRPTLLPLAALALAVVACSSEPAGDAAAHPRALVVLGIWPGVVIHWGATVSWLALFAGSDP